MGRLKVDELSSDSGSISFPPGQRLDLSECTSSIKLPKGTTAQEGSPSSSALRYNTDDGELSITPGGSNWSAQKTRKDSDNLVKDGIIFRIDFADVESYPGTGPYFYDTVGKRRGQLYSDWEFDTSGYLRLDKSKGVNQNRPHATIEVAGTPITDPKFSGNNLSWTSWFRVFDNTSYYIISSGGQTGGASGMALSYQNGVPFISSKGLSGGRAINPITIFPIYNWYHYASVADANGIKFYVNGELVETGASAQAAVTSDGYTKLTFATPNNRLPENTGYTQYEASMDIMNLEFYSRALTDAEVLQNYNALKDREAIKN